MRRIRYSIDRPDLHGNELERLAKADKDREREQDNFEDRSYGIGPGVASVLCSKATPDEILGKAA